MTNYSDPEYYPENLEQEIFFNVSNKEMRELMESVWRSFLVARFNKDEERLRNVVPILQEYYRCL